MPIHSDMMVSMPSGQVQGLLDVVAKVEPPD